LQWQDISPVVRQLAFDRSLDEAGLVLVLESLNPNARQEVLSLVFELLDTYSLLGIRYPAGEAHRRLLQLIRGSRQAEAHSKRQAATSSEPVSESVA
jgi:hypothetical protein